MGMFDEVNESMWCPYCGARIEHWQTKETENLLIHYTLAEFKTALLMQRDEDERNYAEGEIHAFCPACDEFVQLLVSATRDDIAARPAP